MKVFNSMTLKAIAFSLPIVFLSACSESTTDEPTEPVDPPVEECNVATPDDFVLMKGEEKILMNEGNDLGEFVKRVVLGNSGDTEFSFATSDNAFTYGAVSGKGDQLAGDLQVKGEDCGELWDKIVVPNAEAKVAAINAHADKKTYSVEVVDQVTCIDFNWDHTDAEGNKKILWMVGQVNTVPNQAPENAWGQGVPMTQSADNPAIWEADIWGYNPWSETPNAHLEDYNFKVVYNAQGVWGEDDGTYNVDWGNGPEDDTESLSGTWYVKSFTKDKDGNETLAECTNAPDKINDEGVNEGPNTGGCRVKVPGSADKGLHLTFNVETQAFLFEINE
ncbi:hypothetical protein [Persicobacter diffluens]|uniref:C-type lectin domain-containing protein n=1 Tax=Persicobacter diffluens TaxID=981 RepID=A0AAN5AQ46_9BACT|nr:hypothetical protein PEDI_50500 [Persicobacter diffluens]